MTPDILGRRDHAPPPAAPLLSSSGVALVDQGDPPALRAAILASLGTAACRTSRGAGRQRAGQSFGLGMSARSLVAADREALTLE